MQRTGTPDPLPTFRSRTRRLKAAVQCSGGLTFERQPPSDRSACPSCRNGSRVAGPSSDIRLRLRPRSRPSTGPCARTPEGRFYCSGRRQRGCPQDRTGRGREAGWRQHPKKAPQDGFEAASPSFSPRRRPTPPTTGCKLSTKAGTNASASSSPSKARSSISLGMLWCSAAERAHPSGCAALWVEILRAPRYEAIRSMQCCTVR